MNILEALKNLSDYRTLSFVELEKLDIREIELYIRRLTNLQVELKHIRERKLKQPDIPDEQHA